MSERTFIHQIVAFEENDYTLENSISLDDLTYGNFYIVGVSGMGNFPFNYLCIDFESEHSALEKVYEIEQSRDSEFDGSSLISVHSVNFDQCEFSEKVITPFGKKVIRYFHYEKFEVTNTFDIWAGDENWNVNNQCKHFDGFIRIYGDDIIPNAVIVEILKDLDFLLPTVIISDDEISVQYDGTYWEIFQILEKDAPAFSDFENLTDELYESWKYYPVGNCRFVDFD